MKIGDYMQNAPDYFWGFEEDGEVVAVSNGTTIVYRGLLVSILLHLSRQGLPPFGSLLLALLATNPRGKEDIRFLSDEANDDLDSNDIEISITAYRFLERLTDVPSDYKSGTDRLLLLQAIFEECHNRTGVEASTRLAHHYETYIHRGDTGNKSKSRIFRRDFRTLALLERKFPTVESILEKIASLPDLSEELVLDQALEENVVAPAGPPVDLVDRLIENETTFLAGSLVRRIWSGLNIPVRSMLPSDQPVGGVSDLANKGNFDQLLVSEFAYNDLLFLSRIANNEALYIRREVPPEDNNLERVILVDVSIRNWGTPRTVAFATALAITHHPKGDIHCTTYAVGNSFHEVATGTTKGIIAGLQRLYPGLDAAAGIEAFFGAYPKQRDREVILILSRDALKSPQMQKTLTDHQHLIDYWLYTDAEGGLDVYKKQQSSRRHLQRLVLPLKELWKQAPREKQQEGRLRASKQYPLLFRHVATKCLLLPVNDRELFLVTRERRLFRVCSFDSPVTLELIREGLPSLNGEWAMGMCADGTYLLLHFDPGTRDITLTDLTGATTKTIAFPLWRPNQKESFIFHEDRFIHFNRAGKWTSIERDGEVREPSGEYSGLLHRRYLQRGTLAQIGSRTGNVLRNVREVFISRERTLVFNRHELAFDASNILLSNRSGMSPVSMAVRATLEKGVYQFKDGSTVTVNPSGMFILKSSNRDIPAIYIPAVLEEPIGVATETQFSGNEIYRKSAISTTVLRDPGRDRKAVARLLANALPSVHQQVFEGMVECCPTIFDICCSGSERNDLIGKLREAGADVVTEPLNVRHRPLESINPEKFNEHYVRPFIQHILDHEAKS